MSEMKNSLARGRTVVALAALLAVAACGGGGGGDSPSSSSTTTSVSGVASKGLLRYAQVTAYAVKSDGTADKSKALGSAITDDTGKYTITGLTPSIPVILEVTPLAASGNRPATTMMDEATGQGVAVTVASGFSLTAAVVLDSSGTTSAQITPFTNMAVALAQKQAADLPSGVTIADVINAANVSISTALNIPILTEEPTFTSAPNGGGVTVTATSAAAVKLAAISQLAQTDPACSGAGSTLAAIQCEVEKLADDATTAKDDGSVLSSELASLINEAQKAVSTTVTTVAEVTTGTTVTPTDNSTLTTVVAKAKGLIQGVRNLWAALTNKSDSSSLVSRGKVVGDALSASTLPFNQSAIIAVARVLEGMTPGQGYATTTTAWSPINSPESMDVPGAIGGGCSVKTDSTFATDSAATDMQTAQYVGCRITYKIAVESGTAYAYQHIVRATRLTDNATAADQTEQFSVKTALVKQAGTVDGSGNFTKSNTTPINLVTGAALAASDYQTVTVSRVSRGTDPFDGSTTTINGQPYTFQAYNNFAFSGKLAPSLRQYNWGLNHTAVGATDVSISASSGGVAVGNGVTTATTTKMLLTGSFKLLGTNLTTVLSSVSIQDGSYWQAETTTSGYVNGVTTKDGKAVLLVEAKAINGAVLSGSLTADGFVDVNPTNDGDSAIPTKVVFAGTVKESSSATTPLFTGTLTASLNKAGDVAAGNGESVQSLDVFTIRKLVLDGTFISTASNTVHVGLTYTFDLNGEGTLIGSYTQADGHSLQLDMTVSDAITAASHLYLTSLSAAVSLKLDGTDAGTFPTLTNIKSGEVLAGVVDLNAGRITYSDNSYEQF
ncbi:hypothetical protein [Aquabacterium sp.]|uniref:hypothetical protein n=1 Tax=Aquabacterium sp. TaxID=1872578 RepID=UPI0035AF3A79